MLQAVVKAVKVGAIVLDADQRVVLWNQWMSQHSPFNGEAALGKTFVELFPDLENGRTHGAIRAALTSNFASLISQTLNKAPFPVFASPADAAKGNRMQQAVQVMPIEVTSSARHCLVQITDVSTAVAREQQLREKSRELESQTFTDGLTGIANRRRFDIHLEDEFRRAKREKAPISLIMIDVDFFKNYNDNYGHRRGDEVLTQVASALAEIVNRSGDLLARYGGEEFAAILPSTDEEGAISIAEAMRARVESLGLPHTHSGAGHITISLGITTLTPDGASDMATLLDTADRALYKAKNSGRNCVVAYDAYP
ncbi:MAG: diguanylate cyclase [Burkholderiales bacterium]|nr:diguanylate cyclase [Burkholderiales bacterium]